MFFYIFFDVYFLKNSNQLFKSTHVLTIDSFNLQYLKLQLP